MCFSNESLVTVSQNEAGEWILTSLKPFTSSEILTVVFYDGRELAIHTTDAVTGEPVIPVEPDDPVYVSDDPADVTLKKQIDWLGDNGAEGMEDLYRLYLSLETEVIEPMDLLLVIDQSGSMTESINASTYYYDIDLDNIENEGFEYDDDYEEEFDEDVPLSGYLPQTGVLWWPVPIMLCLGILLLTVGTLCRRRDEK